ncbi:MAG: hypothetical protein ACSHYB_04625 [Roseibacillus sp.]
MRVPFFLWFLSFALLWADSEVDDKTAETLVKLAGVIDDTSSALSLVRDVKLGGKTTQEDVETAQGRETELAARLDELKNQFDELATGVRGEDLKTAEEANLDLAEEVKEILRPGVRAMKKATERPRETEMLRAREQRLSEQAELAKNALERLSRWNGGTESSTGQRIEELRELWKGRQNDAEGQLEALAVQMEQQEAEKEPVLKPVSDAFESFFKGRGLNLLKAVGALAGTWLFLRWLWRMIGKLPLVRKQNHGAFGWRLLELSAVVISGGLAAVAALFVLYFSGDWLLLTLAIVLLVGLGWTAKSTIPKTFEQTKMLLNLGPVRKGERLTFEGVPWEVGTIGIYTELRNCELTGGLIRMSIKRLSTLRSRPHDPSESWFPTKTGDWVLANDAMGKVVTQTPEYVQLVRLGGTRETYLTPDFLALAPANLSKSFRVKAIFGIDYAHQAIATTEVAAIFKAKLAAGLVEVLADREQLNSVNVEFASAGASSLDYAIMADFKGEAADRYEKLKRAIQRICVEVCNEKEWGIPFTQVTIHQAE